jgi:hypothetical protein
VSSSGSTRRDGWPGVVRLLSLRRLLLAAAWADVLTYERPPRPLASCSRTRCRLRRIAFPSSCRVRGSGRRGAARAPNGARSKGSLRVAGIVVQPSCIRARCTGLALVQKNHGVLETGGRSAPQPRLPNVGERPAVLLRVRVLARAASAAGARHGEHSLLDLEDIGRLDMIEEQFSLLRQLAAGSH